MSQRGRNKRPHQPKIQATDGHDAPPDSISQRLRKFTEDDWTQYMHDKGTLRALQRDGRLAGSTAFELAPESFQTRFYIPLGRFVNATVDYRESQRESTNRSSAAEMGVGLNLMAGVPAAQVKPDLHFEQHSDAQKSSKQADSQNQHSDEQHFICMQTWPNAQRMILSGECLEFFSDRWSDDFGSSHSGPLVVDLDKALNTFEAEFGHLFYRDVQLGVHGQDINASRQDDLSETDAQGKACQIGGGMNLETPKGGGGFNAHRDQVSLINTSTSTFSERRTTRNERSGGDPSFLLTGKFAQPSILNDPHTWLVVHSLSSDPIPLLELIQSVASRMKRRAHDRSQPFASEEIDRVLDRISELIDYRNTSNEQAVQEREAAARSQSNRKLLCALHIGKIIKFTAPVDDAVVGVQLRQYSGSSSGRNKPISELNRPRDSNDRHYFEIQAKWIRSVKGSSPFVEVKLQLASGWDFVTTTVTYDSTYVDGTVQWSRSVPRFAATKDSCTCTVFSIHILDGQYANFEIAIENEQWYQFLREENAKIPLR